MLALPPTIKLVNVPEQKRFLDLVFIEPSSPDQRTKENLSQPVSIDCREATRPRFGRENG
jgi:hypothetical protein